MAMQDLASDPPDTADELWAYFRSADGIFAVDAEQRITRWSSSAQRILGYSPQQVLGRHCFDVVGGRDSCNFRFCRPHCPILLNAQRGRATHNHDLLARHADGSEVWINVSILVLQRKRKPPVSVIHLFRDVTRRRRLEEQARRALSALRRLASEVQEETTSWEINPSPTPVPPLTQREQEVLRLLACGMGTRQIGRSLGVSDLTARNHITNLVAKLGVENRLQAVVYASEHRLV